MSATGKGDDPGHGQNSPGQISEADREAIRQRSAEIGKKLDAANAGRVVAPKAGRNAGTGAGGAGPQQDYGKAFKYGADLIVGVGLGGLLGWALDRQFGTAPVWMILLVVLGFAAGLLNVFRAARTAQAENEASQLAAPSVADDDDDDK